MPTIAVKPLVLKDVLLKIAEDNYEKHVSSVTFTPSSSQIEWRGLTPDAVFTDSTPPTWSVTLEYAQDWDTTGSLSEYLFDNGGTTVAAEFVPVKGTGNTKFTANVAIQSGAIGGAVGSFATASVTLGCDKPTRGTVEA